MEPSEPNSTKKAYSVSMTGSQLLEYATPVKTPADDTFATLVHGFRRVVFASGVAMFFCGLGHIWIGSKSNDNAYLMTWGGFFAALSMPWPRRKRA